MVKHYSLFVSSSSDKGNKFHGTDNTRHQCQTSSSLTFQQNKLECFTLASFFQASLMFASEWLKHTLEHFVRCSTWISSGLLASPKILQGKKHTSLVRLAVGDEEKKSFIKLTPDLTSSCFDVNACSQIGLKSNILINLYQKLLIHPP